MKRFWYGIIKSILDGLNPNTILEIGVDKGENTKNILEYCAKNECKLISIDPFPDSLVSELEYNYKNEFTLLRDLSLNVLPNMENAQVFFIDGDHNWYTVYNELLCIENKKDPIFPLIFLHDIEWPDDYRDLYYNSADIPPKYRHDYAKKGVELNHVNLLEDGGFNASFNNALVSGTAKNGVFTAIIDFLNQSKYDLKFIKIKGFHGLGIIYDENLYLQNQGFKNSIDELNDSLDRLEDYITRLSNTFYKNINEIAILRGVKQSYNHLLSDKFHLEQAKSNLERDNSNLKVSKDALEKQVRFYEHSNRKKEKRVQNLVKEYKQLKTQFDDLSSALYEVNYADNHGRSLKQRLISKFPSVYILSRRNNDLKNNLLTIKGCKSIKKNNLFDMGYYLRENRDVRKSGVDPLIHYIYYGYKEGRNPNTKFDTNYYLMYSDVKKSKINPLIHYSLYGIQEGRTTHKTKKTSQLSITKKKKLNDRYDASIILPTSNQTKYLGKSIDSVLDQTFSDYELIIVDYGNTDKTKKFIKNNYRHQLKKGKIKYIHNEGNNNNAARNKGLKKARGKVIAYIDTYSCWSNNYLKKMVSSLAENNSNTAYASIEINDDGKNQIIKNTEYDRKTILESSFIDINAFVHKRFLYHQIGDFDGSLNELADWDFILRYTRLNKPYFINEVLVKQFLSKSSQDISKNKLKKEQLKIKKLHSAELIQKELDHLRLGYVLWDFPALSQTFVMNELRWLVKNNYDVKVFYKEKPDREAELDFDIETI
ncbi:MAG: glycosyltransferase, partial [Methanobacteriaceae archaeon]|nr:glycosyltransferase [Methanobacteriaceae archaeon]